MKAEATLDPLAHVRAALLLAGASDAEAHAVLEVRASRLAFHQLVHAYRLAQLAVVADRAIPGRLDELLVISRL